MKALRTFVTTADLLHTYQEGEEFPRAGVTLAPGTIQQLQADGLIGQDKPEETEEKPARAETKPRKARKGG